MARPDRLFAILCFCLFGAVACAQVPAVSSAKAEAVAPGAAAAKGESLSSYKLSTGDVISISVYGEDDLKRDKVRITDGLRGTYLVNPRVAVTIDEYRPYFINGQVTNNGSFPYQPDLTVRKAVAVAGGFKERASMSKITIVRDGDPTNTPVKADLNTPVHPGDIITVGESFF